MIINFKSLENLTQLVIIINNIWKLLNTKYEIYSSWLFTVDDEDVNFIHQCYDFLLDWIIFDYYNIILEVNIMNYNGNSNYAFNNVRFVMYCLCIKFKF